jgi:hypothetical protein
MDQTLCIGTVVERNGKRLMVAGYNLVDEDGHVGLAYLLVPCPLGFVQPDSFVLLSATDYGHVSNEGYKNKDVMAFCSSLDELRLNGASIPFEEYRNTMEDLAQEVLGAAQGEE